MAWTGFVLAGALEVRRRPGLRAAVSLAAPTAMSFLCGSPETLLWQILLTGALLVPTPSGRRLRTGVTAGLAVGWGLLATAIVFLPAAEHARKQAPLAAAEALAWSASLVDLLALAWPAANQPITPGGSSQTLILNLHLGTLVVALAVTGFVLIGRARRARLAPLALSALGLAVLSLGSGFAPSAAILELFPLRLFRYPVKYVLGTAFVLCLFAALGLDRVAAWVRRSPRSRRLTGRALLPAAGVAGLGGLALALLRMPAGAGPGLVMALLLLVGAGGAIALLPGGPRERGWRARRVLLVFGGIEMAAVHAIAGPPLTVPARSLTAPSSIAETIRGDGRRMSVGPMATEWPPAGRSVGFAEARSYIASSRRTLVPKRNVEERIVAFEGYEARIPRRHARMLEQSPRALFDAAAVGWFLRRGPAPFEDLVPVALGPGTEEGPQDVEPPALYRNLEALPRVSVVHRAEIVGEAGAAAALSEPEQRFRGTAFVELAPGQEEPALRPCAGSTARIIAERSAALAIEVEACGEGLLVIADSWAPGWSARIGARQVPVYRANYLFRAVPVERGRQVVELSYSPGSVRLGAALSSVATLGMLLVAIAPVFRRRSPG